MRILLLNTCGLGGSVSLADTSLTQPVKVLAKMPGRSAAEMLVAVIRQGMTQVGWKVTDLAAVAVVTGPGSFTGVRVGLSAAKGLAEATGVPMIAVSRLALLSAAAPAKPRAPGAQVCALLDAGRSEFYCGQYVEGRLLRERLLSLQDAVDTAREADSVLVCEEAVQQAMSEWVHPNLVDEPTAADALPFALRRFHEGTFDDPVTLDANYLRRTDEEIFATPIKRRAS